MIARTLAGVAQWIEQRSSKPKVMGSNPISRAILLGLKSGVITIVIIDNLPQPFLK